MILPTKKTKPKQNFEEYTTLIYGAPKTGKSTLASQFDNALFLATEAGLNSLETYNVTIDSWQSFLEACSEIAKGEHNFKTIIIDTVDNLYDFCSVFICKRYNVQYEGDLDWGKGYKFVKDEFLRAINKLTSLPYGVVLISHVELIEIKTPVSKTNKYTPSISKRVREDLLGLCDFVFFCDIEHTEDGDKRILITKPADLITAGDRTGKFPARIDMSYSAIKNNFEKALKGDTK